MKRIPLKISDSKLILETYQQTYNLGKAADILNVSLETLRKFFIANNMPYKKQVKYDCDHFFFSRDNERSFYWAGFLAADGNIDGKKNRIILALATKDKDHLEKLKLDIECPCPIFNQTRKDARPAFKQEYYYKSTVRFTSKQMVQDLLRFNVVPLKSKIFKFPINLQDNDNVRHYIRGLIDGDGWIYTECNSSCIGLSGTPDCVNAVFNILKQKCGLKSGCSYVREDGLGIMHSGRLDDNLSIINYLYNDAIIYLDRKKITADQILKCQPRKIKILKEDIEREINNFNTLIDLEDHLGKQFGVSSITIRRRIKEYKILAPANYYGKGIHNKLLDIINKEQLINDWNELKSISLISKKYNIKKYIVSNALDIEGINHSVNKKLSMILTEELLREVYGRLKTIRGVARELGEDRSGIRNYLIKYNILLPKSI